MQHLENHSPRHALSHCSNPSCLQDLRLSGPQTPPCYMLHVTSRMPPCLAVLNPESRMHGFRPHVPTSPCLPLSASPRPLSPLAVVCSFVLPSFYYLVLLSSLYYILSLYYSVVVVVCLYYDCDSYGTTRPHPAGRYYQVLPGTTRPHPGGRLMGGMYI